MSNDVSQNITLLTASRDHARSQFFRHCDPGNLTPAQKIAFRHRSMAYLLMLKAAQMELDAETQLQSLLVMESAA